MNDLGNAARRCLVLAVAAGMAAAHVFAGGSVVDIVPLPVKMTPGSGSFTITAKTVLHASPGLEAEARYFAGLLKPATGIGLTLKSLRSGKTPDGIVLELDPALKTAREGAYVIRVTEQQVLIRAGGAKGIFYGLQTLRQMLPVELEKSSVAEGVVWSLPCVEIEDSPRFQWRGAMLDSARHFISVENMKRFIDLMALHKLNVLHWHLTDDQGWRVEIRKYPRLTEIGSWRKESPVEGNRNKGDGKRYGGFYTQAQLREVVAYAASRHITVVPEIEMPGHGLGALAAYPNLGCTGGPYEIRTRWGVEPDVFCAGNPEVYTFLEDVLTEILAIFPSTFIHIGGDECPKDRWNKCPKCAKAMADKGLKNAHELQSHFVRHFDKWLAAHGRRLIGWDEILEGGLAPGAAVMNWRKHEYGIEAAKEGHDVVMSPTSHCYLDYAQAKGAGEPETIGGFLPLEKVYGFEPVPAALAPERHRHILGTQGNLWSEYMFNYSRVEYMAFPRLSALAEVAWTRAEAKDYGSFISRLDRLLARMKVLGVNFRVPREAQPAAAAWKSGETGEVSAEKTWDVTKAVGRPGSYEIVFQFTHGTHRLDIAWAALVVNGREAGRDEHAGVTGATSKDNVYRISVGELPAGARVELKASVRSDGGNDSNGQISVRPAS